MSNLEYLDEAEQRQIQEIQNRDDDLSSLSHGELIQMPQKQREDQRLQKLYDPRQSNVQVTPQTFMVLRHEHENEGYVTYHSIMMRQTIQNQCKRAKEDQAKITDQEQQIKKLTLDLENTELLQIEVAHKRVHNEVKIVQLEEKIKTLTSENRGLSLKCFKLNWQNGIMQSNHQNEIEEKDKYIATLVSQLDSEPETPSDSGKS